MLANEMASVYCLWSTTLRSSSFFRSSGGKEGFSCRFWSIDFVVLRALSIEYSALAYLPLISSSHFALSGTLFGAWKWMSLTWLTMWGGIPLACGPAAGG